MTSLIGNQALLTKVYFPRYVFAVSKMVANIINHLPELAVLIIIVTIVIGLKVPLYVPVLAVVVLMTALFATGLGLVLSILMVYFRDMQYLWGISTKSGCTAFGVVFPPVIVLDGVAENLPDAWHRLWGAPVATGNHLSSQSRGTLLGAVPWVPLRCWAMPAWQVWAGTAAWTGVALVAGILVFRRYQDRIVEEL